MRAITSSACAPVRPRAAPLRSEDAAHGEAPCSARRARRSGDLNIAARTGSLTRGKRADLILVRTSDINMTPFSDPYETLVTYSQPRNVDTMIADGRILVEAAATPRSITRKFRGR